MEEHIGCKKFHFPGYDGALPKSTRTSRGRSAYQGKVSQKCTDTNCIDLLATVAGQISQSKYLRQEIVEAQNIAATCKPGAITGSHFAALPRAEHLKIQGKAMIDDVIELQNLQGTIKIGQNIHGKNSAINSVKWADCSSNNSCLHNAKSDINVKEAEAEDCSDDDQPNVNLLRSTSELPQPGCPSNSLCHEHPEETNLGSERFRGTTVNKRNGHMISLPDGQPEPLRIRGRQDAIIHVHKQLNRFCSEQLLDSQLDFIQDLVRFRAKDDDEKFSNLVVPMTTQPRRHLLSSVENTEGRMGGQGKGEAQQEAVSVAVAQKNTTGTDGTGTDVMFDGESCFSCMRHFSSQQLKHRKRKRILKPAKVVIDPYNNPIDSDAKDTSVGSSLTAHDASRRSTKRISNEAHDCSPVKVNITSFRVPELSINLPETATVASLKRAVMEAAVNLLGGGLHVRVLHHGNKIHDENSTLIQMGIACKDRMDSLTFMLEPSGVSHTSMNMGDSLYRKGHSQHAVCNPVSIPGNNREGSGKETLQEVSNVNPGMDSPSKAEETPETNSWISNLDEWPNLQQCVPPELPTPTAAALILHPCGKADMPVDFVASHGNYVSFAGKRRTRRPFSVIEVEALVQAVELLGTGRLDQSLKLYQ